MKTRLIVLSHLEDLINPEAVLDYLFACSSVEQTDPTIEYNWSSSSVVTAINEPELGGVWHMAAFDIDITPQVEGVPDGVHVVTLAKLDQMPLVGALVELHAAVMRYDGGVLASIMHLPLSYDDVIELQAFTYTIPELQDGAVSLLDYLKRDQPSLH